MAKKKIKKHRIKTWVIVLFAILDLGALSCLFLAYANKNFKSFIITTSMSTMRHQYIAKTLYSSRTIDKVLKENTIIELDEEVDLDSIKVGTYEKENFESETEEEILKKDKGNDLYKLITKKENGKTFYITVIYDPSRISLGITSKLGVEGETVKQITKNNNAILGINASGFEDLNENGNGGMPTGTVIKDGKILWESEPSYWGSGYIGFNKDHKLVLTKESAETAIKNGMVDGVQFGPFLIVNGKEAEVLGNGGTGTHPRTIIAQRQDGIVLFIVIDGNGSKYGFRGGVNFREAIDLLKKYKAYNASNLDGGASSILVINNEIINNPVGYGATGERRHPTSWMLK